MNKKILSLLFTIILLSSVPNLFSYNEVIAEELSPINKGITEMRAKINSTYARGNDWEVTALRETTFKAVLGLPTRIWSETSNKYVSYIFVDKYNSDGYYEVSNGRIGARIYDYYATFYSPDMSEIRLYDERWEVERFRPQGQGSWSDIGAQSGEVNWFISQNFYTINVTKSFTSWAGLLSITYTFREGEPLKHTVIFTSSLESETYRVAQKWAGIVSDNVKKFKLLDQQKDSVFVFTKTDGKFVIAENQHQAIQWLEPVIFESHAQGMKTNYIFSNWTLTQGESLTIDPDTETLTPVTSWSRAIYGDAVGAACGSTFSKDNIKGFATHVAQLRANNVADQGCYRTSPRFNTSIIDDGALILDVVIKFDVSAVTLPRVTDWYQMSNDPDAATAENLWNDAGDGNLYVDDTAETSTVGNNKQLDLGADANQDLQNLLGADWFAVGVKYDDEVRDGSSSHRVTVDDTAGTGTPRWTLEVTFAGVSTITASFYAQDGTTTADDLTPVYITMTNTTDTFVFSLTGLTVVMGGQDAGENMVFSARAYNTTNGNSPILINGSNTITHVVVGPASIRFWLGIFQSTEWTYQKNNGTGFTASFLEITFGNNGTKANVTQPSIWVNGSNTVHQIRWLGDNVKNSTDTFEVTGDNQDLVFEGRIYTLRLTARDTIKNTIPSAVHYNLTLANSTVVNPVTTTGGIVGIYLQNDTSPVTITSWWHGTLVNVTTSFIISGDNSSVMNLQVGSDGSSKTLFASGTDEKGIHAMMIEGIEASYQIEPTSLILNGTTYTNATWIGTAWNYTSGLNLLNATYPVLKATTVIHTISIDTVNRQVSFNATGSETSWLISYGGVACAGTIRTINLVNELDSSPFDAGGFYNVNVTAFYSDFFLVVSQNNATFTVCDEPLLVASINVTSTGTTYFRTLIPSKLTQNMYIPDIRESDIELYTLNFIDLTDSFEGSTIRIFISGIEVASGFVDSAFRFQVYLIDGHLFTVTLTSTTDSFTAGGLNANPAATSITVTIGSIDIISDRDIRNNIVAWAAVWVGVNIQVQYEDLENATTALEITIYEQNFENKTYVVLFNQAFGVNSSVTVLQAANISRGHYVKTEYTQPSFGSVTEQKVPVRSNLGFPMPNLPASILGMDTVFPGVPNAWVFLISLMIVIGTAFAFGALFSVNGAIIVGVIGIFLTTVGWLPGTVAYAIAATAIAVVSKLTRERSK